MGNNYCVHSKKDNDVSRRYSSTEKTSSGFESEKYGGLEGTKIKAHKASHT